MANKTLYVGNLPYTVTESHLTSHFSTYGASNVRIIEGRGFGFVDVDSDKLDSAIADKHNSAMEGRTLTVNEAKPRENRNASNSDRSYGGGSSRGQRW
ncbi:MAG: RNA recognition motif domain-containing protein [Fimbriimonas sp.]